MADSALLDEIDDLKDRVESLTLSLEELKEERDSTVADLQDKLSYIRLEVEREWRLKLKDLERTSQEQVDSVLKELDTMRAAFSGDAMGWIEKVTKAGITYYENTESGEVKDDEPECLYIAKAFQKVKQAEEIKDEFDKLKITYTNTEKKRRDGEMLITKMKTEMNSLKSIDRLWKESAKTVYNVMNDVKDQFDSQIDQIIDGLSLVDKTGKRCHTYIPHISSIKTIVCDIQKRMVEQEAELNTAKNQIRMLSNDLADKNSKVLRLSKGLEDEIERLSAPMRDKMSECMVLLMKEKASRAQERRDLAVLWPTTSLLPSFLMKHRPLTDSERLSRLEVVKKNQASIALTLEIQANIAESKLWEMKYDDYGRPFYQHMKTNETSQEEPEILSYKPPPGRDDMGNLVITNENSMLNYSLHTDYKGEVYYRHVDTGEVTYIAPTSYVTVPRAKSAETIVSEAAQVVLAYIKDKIKKHVVVMNRKREACEANSDGITTATPTTTTAAASAAIPAAVTTPDAATAEEVEEDLRLYMYDIETVEMLANIETVNVKSIAEENVVIREEGRADIKDTTAIRKFDELLYEGPPSIEHVNTQEITVEKIKETLEALSIKEDTLETHLRRTRNIIKDYSYLLLDRIDISADGNGVGTGRKVRNREVVTQRELDMEADIRAAKIDAGEDNDDDGVDVDGNGDGDGIDQAVVPIDVTDANDNNASSDTIGGTAPLTQSMSKTDGQVPTTDTTATAAAEGGDADAQGDDNADMKAAADGDDNKSVTSELTEAVKLTPILPYNGVIFLFGDPDIDGLPYENIDSIVASSELLSNLALFCGFTDTHLDKIYEDAPIPDFELKYTYTGDTDSSCKLNEDDDWLTKSFFISLTADKLDAIRDAMSLKYDPMMGLLNSTQSLETVRLQNDVNFTGRKDIQRPYAATSLTAYESISNEQALWKSSQLMSEVFRYQFQQEAVREAVKNRMAVIRSQRSSSVPTSGTGTGTVAGTGTDAGTGTVGNGINSDGRKVHTVSLLRNDYFVSGIKSHAIRLTIKQIVMKESMVQAFHKDQYQCIQLSINEWAVKTSYMRVTRLMRWDQLQYESIVPKDTFLFSCLCVEILDETASAHSIRVGKGTINLGFLLKESIGTDALVDVVMRDEYSNQVGVVALTLSADLYTVAMHERDTGIANREVNYYSSGLQVEASVETGLRDDNNRGKAVTVDPNAMVITDAFGVDTQVVDDGVDDGVDEAKKGDGVETVATAAAAADGSGSGGDVVNDGIEEKKDDDTTGDTADGDGTAAGTATGPIAIDDGTFNNIDVGSLSVEESKVDLSYIGTNRQGGSIDTLSGIFPSLHVQQSDFAACVADLRGDSDNFIRMMIGDITLTEVLKLGYRPTPSTIKKLPDISNAVRYLKKKKDIHTDEVTSILDEIEKSYTALEVMIKENVTSCMCRYDESKKKYQQATVISEKYLTSAKAMREEIDEVKDPLSPPLEAVFAPLEAVLTVPSVSAMAALDDKGKKKKPYPGNNMKELLEEIEKGSLDGLPVFPVSEFYPSQAQMVKINKSIIARNDALVVQREEVIVQREEAIGKHNDNMDRWEKDEKARKKSYNRRKKESRKLYIKYECSVSRQNRLYVEYNALESNANVANNILEMNRKSMDRFKVMRMKQYLEKKRQYMYIKSLKRRLLVSLDARRRALDLPATAINDVQYEEFRLKAEESLRILRLEVYDTRQQLLIEGTRMRYLYDEELSSYKAEYNRVKVMHETVTLRTCIESILLRNQYDVLYLMTDMEKLMVIEADKDERGIRYTVDNLGERYTSDRVWESEEVLKCQKLIDLVMAKITQAEGILMASATTQRCLFDCISTKYSIDFTPTRTSWVERSDYDRCQRLMADCVQWVTHQRKRLRDRETIDSLENVELKLQIHATTVQNDVNLQVHDTETDSITASSLGIIGVLQSKLDTLITDTSHKVLSLEASITSLSRELQVVRENALIKDMENAEKAQILWALINTLQRTVQTSQGRMEIVIEDRDKTVIASKLEQDRLKHELRCERKHAANLLMIIHSLQGTNTRLRHLLSDVIKQAESDEGTHEKDKKLLRKEIWEYMFCFTRLCTDVDYLFEFFASRLANIAGSRKAVNDQLASSGAALVLSALCKSPRSVICKYAARALAGMGWDTFVETRILVWDCVMYWKMIKTRILSKEKEKAQYDAGLAVYEQNRDEYALLNIEGVVEEFTPSGNMSLRSLIQQRRQWALRATRRVEGPNRRNMKLLNVRDGVIPALLDLCLKEGKLDWEIARNAALAICIASYEVDNHIDISNNSTCVSLLVQMLYESDAEVQTHAAVTIANLCHKDEHAQAVFGKAMAIPALLSMCKYSIVDLLEAATAALANLTCYHDINCSRVIDADGVNIMVTLITTAYTENVLDIDQNDECHANAVEMLANVSRFSSKDTTRYFNGSVIDALIVMCASQNAMVKRHVPLVLGNIGQSDICRAEISDRGGIEALFLTLEDQDKLIQANCLWALCNLMWYPPNQERAGRFITEVLSFVTSSFLPIASHASILLANMLYYNNANRIRLLEIDGTIEYLLQYVKELKEIVVVEANLRSILSLSYFDSVSAWLGTDGAFIPTLIGLLHMPYHSRDTMRFSLEIISNMCIHHSNRRLIIDCNGIDAFVNLYSDVDPYIQELSASIVRVLEDVTPPEVLARIKVNIPLERMVTLATDSDPLVRAVAAETIGEEIWKNPSHQKRIHDVGGVDALLSIIANASEGVASLLPALWSLRNLMQNNLASQNQLAYRDGIAVILAAVTRSLSNLYVEQTEKVLEACLASIVSAIVSHERNSRKLLSLGLELLMDLVEGTLEQSYGADKGHVKQALKAEGVLALARYILTMLGPYNYVVCKNCHKKQDLHGTACFNCGYRLLVDDIPTAVKTHTGAGTATGKIMKRNKDMSSSSSNSNKMK